MTADAERAIEIAALTGQRASYDSHYLALAERLGCELWTADDRFRDAARGSRVQARVRGLSEI
jgi:predicted nucleic acid-binding protein